MYVVLLCGAPFPPSPTTLPRPHNTHGHPARGCRDIGEMSKEIYVWSSLFFSFRYTQLIWIITIIYRVIMERGCSWVEYTPVNWWYYPSPKLYIS